MPSGELLRAPQINPHMTLMMRMMGLSKQGSQKGLILNKMRPLSALVNHYGITGQGMPFCREPSPS